MLWSIHQKRYDDDFNYVITLVVQTDGNSFFCLQQTIQLGIQVQPTDQKRMNISLFYTDIAKSSSSQIVASFQIPYVLRAYVKFAIKVSKESITLIHNCRKPETVHVKRHTEELLFDSASTLYLGQAGPIIKGNLDVSTVIQIIDR